jgi:NADPH-ferrihemoprotein reductase
LVNWLKDPRMERKLLLIYPSNVLILTVCMYSKIIFDAKRPYIAPVTSRELFHGTDRHCMHVEVDVSNTNISYTTGDHLAIWPTNNEIEVNRLASVLGLTDKLDTVVMVKAIDPTAPKKHPFPVPTTYRSMFRHYMEINAPISRQILNSFVEYAPSEEAKAALTKLATDKDEYRIHVSDACRNLGEVLQLVAGNDTRPGLFSKVPFDLIVENVARMQPRFYSISSSAKESPKLISATIVTLAYQPTSTPHRTVYGVNSHFLYSIQMQNTEINQEHPVYDLAGPRQAYLENGVCQKVPVHVRHSQFKLPRNPTVPVIMVGPGTGVAPFRGFVRERALEKRNGKPVGTTLLFYGSRNQAQDYLYADEWPELFETLGGDSRIITAFSRDQAQKIYVQHRLQQEGAHVWSLLQKGGYVYVCGDAKSMARDVNQSFINCAIEFGGLTDVKAHEYVKSLRTTGRYQEDVWS